MGAIICGIDDSESARGAARVARGLSGELGLDLVFVRDGGAEWVVALGRPADQLVAAATKAKAALIVVGSHGPRSSSLGSISLEVSRRAPCPVVVVPPGAERGFHGTVVTGRASRTPDTAVGAQRST
jgi:Universal stress protein family